MNEKLKFRNFEVKIQLQLPQKNDFYNKKFTNSQNPKVKP